MFLKRFFTMIATYLILFSFTLISWSNVVSQEGAYLSISDLAEKLLNTTVNISIIRTAYDAKQGGEALVPIMPESSPLRDYFKDEKNGEIFQKVHSSGSGFVIDAQEGFIVTNYHVVAEADDIEANFTDGTKLKAKLVGMDRKTDLALLQVNPGSKKLTAVRFGDSEKMRVGDFVMAIGSPYGFSGTVTVGIISTRNRNFHAGPYDNFIQTDAAINQGNSGGPLFNRNGEVIGINTALFSPSGGSNGIGFAIPSSTAIPVINQLRDSKAVKRGWLAIHIQSVTKDIAENMRLSEAVGALVAGKIEHPEVDNSQLDVGDVILYFGKEKIENARSLSRLVAESPVGKSINVTVLRDGKEKEIRVKLGRLVEIPFGNDSVTKSNQGTSKNATVQFMGMTLSELTDDLRRHHSISHKLNGLIITFVEKNSVADKKHFQVGEIITEVDQEAVVTISELQKRFYKLHKSGRKNALFIVARPDGKLRFVAVQVD
ncbi:Do family serine endopeptidase [Bartonella ancashensis]|uniref:HtrA protease/chaperone protein n=1 Tax=Bartonella ancashensis TaxID=1318743 RepID=A0A0M3T306_9HYPH|nr:Do family serine endopeptidase [Bartonella ancashensis]ALE03645.1 HtrA protease/chaperone protein [Bartonella ancashensis]